jgi:eukaryotic-like serine/threonine-protein kinase
MHRCFDEEQAVRLAAGLFTHDQARRALDGVEACPDCRTLLVEAGNALRAPNKLENEAFGTGDVLLGRYQIQAHIGQGGMGQVFAALDLTLGHTVALKRIRAELSLEPKMLARFRQELHVASRVPHPNVVRVFDFCGITTQSGQSAHFFTMELLSGQPLSRWRLRRGRRNGAVDGSLQLTTQQRIGVLRQVACGLAAIHEHQIVHRDLKPENIMLCSSGAATDSDASAAQLRAVVLDFGVARSPERVNGLATTSAGLRLGTPDYMAPEVLLGHAATPASDIFSFGLVAYEFLCGRHPYPHRGSRVALSALGELHTPPPTEHNPELPAAVSTLILQCLREEPTARPCASDVIRRL